MRKIIIIGLLISIFATATAQPSTSAVADPILDVTVKDESGSDRLLRNLLSDAQPTFLIIWEAKTCSPCAKIIKDISDSLAHKRISASIIPICVLDTLRISRDEGIDPWTSQRIAYKDLKGRFNLKVNNYYDERNQIINKLKLEAFPLIYVISGGRTILSHNSYNTKQLFEELAKKNL